MLKDAALVNTSSKVEFQEELNLPDLVYTTVLEGYLIPLHSVTKPDFLLVSEEKHSSFKDSEL